MKEAKLKNTLTFISRELNGFSFDLTYCKHLMICSSDKVAETARKGLPKAFTVAQAANA